MSYFRINDDVRRLFHGQFPVAEDNGKTLVYNSARDSLDFEDPASQVELDADGGPVKISNAQTITGLKTFGTGDEQDVYSVNRPGLAARVYHGTAAAPVTAVGPTLKVNRTEQVTRADVEAVGGVGTDGAHMLAAVQGVSSGVAATEVQPVGVYGGAKTSSTYAGEQNDACGVYGIGRVQGAGADGVGIGGFMAGRRDVDTAKVTALEVACANYTATASVYNRAGNGFGTQGFWVTAPGTAKSGVGMLFGKPAGRQFFDAGIVFNNSNPIETVSISDDGNAVTSLYIGGSHTTGIDLSGATLSGFALRTAAGHRALIGASSTGFSTTSFEVIRAGGADPFVCFRATDASSIAVQVQNSAGGSRYFAVGTAGDFFTGSASGDTGIAVNTAAKTFHLGGTTKVVSVTRSNTLGFFAATPVAQQTGTPAAATDLATVISLANSLRTSLLALGLVAS